MTFRVITPALVLLTVCSSAWHPAAAATSITQYGITWTFDRDYPAGQFATGDWWVVGPVNIVNISPRDTIDDGRHVHGTVFNPTVAVTQCQGFDTRISLTIANGGATDSVIAYCDDSHQNRNRVPVGTAFPISVPAETSVLSSESYLGALPEGCSSTPCHRSWIKTIAVLTVLSHAPAPGAFRPPYVGTDKSIKPMWNVASIDYEKLNRLPPLPSTPSLETVLTYAVEPQIEINTGYLGRYLHPYTNYSPARFPGEQGNNAGYGQAIANTYGAMLLAVNLNYSNAQKAPLVHRLVQIGVDIYGAALNAQPGLARDKGIIWANGGGHNGGRKMPMLFAGLMLPDADMLARANHASYRIFQEDSQFFYVTAADVAIEHTACCGRPYANYTAADIGMPEWGQNHIPEPQEDNRLWEAAYRNIAGSSSMPHVLAAKLMGAGRWWNQSAIFDYYETRFYPLTSSKAGQPNEMEVYVRDLWAAYYATAEVPLGILRMIPRPPTGLRIVRD